MSNKVGARNQAAYEYVKDALRYRWIRRGGCPFAETDDAWDSPEALDAAVDAVIAFEAMTPEERRADVNRRFGWDKEQA